jgi:hypothetical protein
MGLRTVSLRGTGVVSDLLYYRRRAQQEAAAALRALTDAARERRSELAAQYLLKARELESVHANAA